MQINYVAQLPDAYKKDENSNNAKLLNLNRLALKDLHDDIEDVNNALDLSQATGKTLDLYGGLLDEPRGNSNDIQYRALLYAKISRNFLKGDYENTIIAIATALRINTTDFKMKEHETRCAVEFSEFPISVLEKTGFKTRQVGNIIKQLLPVGVEMIIDVFGGSFLLCENEGEMSKTAGLSDLEGTIGGSLALVYGEDD